MIKTIKSSLMPLLLSAAFFAGCTDPSRVIATDVAPTEEDAALAGNRCPATTATITSLANSADQKQTCLATLPEARFSDTAIQATVSNGGTYTLLCNRGGKWSATATTSYCPPPAVGTTPPPEPTPTPTPTPEPTPTPTPTTKSRGIRLDPAYFYSSHPGQTPAQVAKDVVTTLKNAKVNTLYLYAYNSIHGSLYPTTYANTAVENGYGAQNIFGAVTAEAKLQGLTVVAVIPLTNFKKVWDNNPTWRVKQGGGVDYTAFPGTYLLSASSAEYRAWYTGFINDLVARNPKIDYVEAVEPTLDFYWSGAPDQHPAAMAKFGTEYPGSAVGSQAWLDFRAKEFLSLIALFNQTVHANNKLSAVVNTWTINSSTGKLASNLAVRNGTGFDFLGVATLTGTSKTDRLVTEFIWQQWFAEYGNALFNPSWITSIAAEYTALLKNSGSTTDAVIHVEISNFTGGYNSTTPTLQQFGDTMAATALTPNGVSIYDYNQVRYRGAFTELSRWAP